MIISHKDSEFREKNKWANHEYHCNEMAILWMLRNGYNPGKFNQDTEIRTSAPWYIDNGYAHDLPPAGTVGYVFYYGENKDGSVSWNHQESYLFKDGILKIWLTEGNEKEGWKWENWKPEKISILTVEEIKNKTWKKKYRFIFVPTDRAQ